MNNLNSIVDYLKVFNNINKRKPYEPRTMANGGLMEEYHGKDKLDWMENFKDQMTFEEYLRWKRSGSFAQGGRIGLKPGGIVEPGVEYYAKVKKQKVGKYTLERTGASGDLKMRNVSADPLTSYEKIKIKKQFPKIKKWDFRNYPYGVAAKNTKNYDGVRHFVARGFVDTTKFKVLPVSVQNEIKEQFPKIKKWDFKKYAYGVSPARIGEKARIAEGLPPKDNRALIRQIARFIDEPEEFRYNFRVGNADGFTLYSMDRAYLQGNENYKPIKRKGKIVGFIDKTKAGKGLKYYYNGYSVNNELKAGELLIKDHPHFNNIKKFHDVALRSKLSLDETSDVFKQLFPKGFDTSKIKFGDLVQFVSNKSSHRNIYNAIVKHHTMGVGASPTADLQILTSVFNKQADDIGKLIKNKDFSRVQELKDKGIRIIVDGKAYGAPKETAEAGFQRIFKDVKTDIKTWTPKEFKSFNSFINQNKRGGALLTHEMLNKSKKFKGTKICKTDFASGGGGLCGKAFAEADPQAYLNKVAKIPGVEQYLKSKDGLNIGRSLLDNARKIRAGKTYARIGMLSNPLTLVGGEAWYSWLAGRNEWSKGASLGEAVNEGLWFIPGKHSRDLDTLLGKDRVTKEGRNLGAISEGDRANFDMLTELGGLINKEGSLQNQLFDQQWETQRLEDLKAKRLHQERFEPTKIHQDPKYFENLLGDIKWSKDVTTPGIEKKLADVSAKGEDVVERWKEADPTGASLGALDERIRDFITDKFHKKRTWTSADPYSGEEWNWIKRNLWERPAGALDMSEQALTQRQKKLDELTEGGTKKNWKELERFWEQETGGKGLTIYDKQDLPPELIENFLVKFPEYSYLFEGAEGGIASLIKKK